MGALILVVDDDDEIRRVLRYVLEPLGRILEATNGKDGLRLLAEGKPDLLLLDVNMPEMDGLETLKAARALAPLLPVLMLTGETDIAKAKRALDDGANSYMTKPFDSDALCAEVRRLTGGAEGSSVGGRPWTVRK